MLRRLWRDFWKSFWDGYERTYTEARRKRLRKPSLIDSVDVNLSGYRIMADSEHRQHFMAVKARTASGDWIH